MLEEMREPGAALNLVSRADVVIDGDRDYRRRMIFGKHHPKSVFKGELRERDLKGLSWNCERKGGDDESDQEYGAQECLHRV